jgi:DNA-binding GntR family transcriptional regulator
MQVGEFPVCGGMDLLHLPSGKYPTKQAMVHAALREAILSGRLRPGERVVIDEVARRFGVSIIPVREALRQLEAERLVSSQPHVGPVVTGFDEDAVNELFTLLECLEIAAARHAVERAKPEDLIDLGLTADAVERAAPARWEEANARFHARLAACAHMPRITEMLAGVSSEWERLYRLRFRDAAAPDRTRAEAEHRAFLACLERRDLDGLESGIREHNRRALNHYRG